MKKRMTFLLLGFGLAVLGCSAFALGPIYGQTFPNQPIQMVITLAPGDSLDLTGRAIGTEMA